VGPVLEDEHQEQAAQQLEHLADERRPAEVAQEVVHDDAEQDDPADGERQRHRRVDEELAVAEQRRDPGPVAALVVSARMSHGLTPSPAATGGLCPATGWNSGRPSERCTWWTWEEDVEVCHLRERVASRAGSEIRLLHQA
jgi:hypothetical protein